jgi:hypothetical protein
MAEIEIERLQIGIVLGQPQKVGPHVDQRAVAPGT